MKVIVLQFAEDNIISNVLYKKGNWSKDELYAAWEASMRKTGEVAQAEWKKIGKRGFRSSLFFKQTADRLGTMLTFYNFLLSKGFKEIEFAVEYE